MDKIKKIRIDIKNMPHLFYNYLFIKLDDKLINQARRKKLIGFFSKKVDIYCANNLCIVSYDGKIIKIIKDEKLIEESLKFEIRIKDEIINGMRKNISFYKSEDFFENTLFVLSGKKILTSNDIFKDTSNLEMASYLPELYKEIIKQYISMEKSIKNKKIKILNLIKYIKNEKLAYEIFLMGDNYTKSQMLEVLINTELNIDIIKYAMIKNNKYTQPLSEFITHVVKKENSIEYEYENKVKLDNVEKTILRIILLYLLMDDIDKIECKKSINELKRLRYNRNYHDFLYDLDY